MSNINTGDALALVQGLKNLLAPFNRAEEILTATQTAENAIATLEKSRQNLLEDVAGLESALSAGQSKLAEVENRAKAERSALLDEIARKREELKNELDAQRAKAHTELETGLSKLHGQRAELDKVVVELHKQKSTLESSVRILKGQLDAFRSQAAKL